ncbi:hypothetical protein V1281_001421 [Nitrobacteraceae bacterium AZCC 2161]
MSWVEDRDQLITETMAFVKEVSVSQPELAAELQAAVALEVEAAKNPVQIVPPQFKALEIRDLREDIRRRVAAFKGRQQKMENEREAYAKQTMDTVRATLRS